MPPAVEPSPGLVAPPVRSVRGWWRRAAAGLAQAADRAMPEFDLGFAMLESVVGVALGLVACCVGALWRITTPVPADPVSFGRPEPGTRSMNGGIETGRDPHGTDGCRLSAGAPAGLGRSPGVRLPR